MSKTQEPMPEKKKRRNSARRNRRRREPGRNAVRRERARDSLPQRIRVVRDTETVFRAAILEGVLSAEPSHRNYAGNYLYMYHDEDGTAWFKHRLTRAYVSMAGRRRSAGAGR